MALTEEQRAVTREVWQYVNDQRLARGLEVNHLMRSLGLHRSTWTKWSHGQFTFKTEQLLALEDLLGLERGDLLQRAGKRIPVSGQDGSFIGTVLRLPDLTDDEKRLLLELYETFRRNRPPTPSNVAT